MTRNELKNMPYYIGENFDTVLLNGIDNGNEVAFMVLDGFYIIDAKEYNDGLSFSIRDDNAELFEIVIQTA